MYFCINNANYTDEIVILSKIIIQKTKNNPKRGQAEGNYLVKLNCCDINKRNTYTEKTPSNYK